MAWWVWLIFALCVPVVWFLWTVLHEVSHVAMARAFRKLERVKFWLWPHFDENNNFYFARVKFWWREGGPLNKWEMAAMKFAPRIMNLVAAICFPFLASFGLPGMLFWGLFWGAGLVDFIVGSLGIRPQSDLRTGAEALGVNPMVFRVVGFFIILVSIMWGVGNIIAFFA